MPLIAPFAHLQTVVFDFDGTLARLTLDFNELNTAVYEAVRQVFPKAPPFEPPALEWVDACLRRARPENTELAELIRCRAEAALLAVEVAAARKGELFSHTRPLLARLHADGTNIGVITRNCRAAVLTVFPDLEDHCLLLAREDVPAPKPDPAHLLRMLNLLRSGPAQSLMVGDHPLDILTGQRAGTMTVGVTCGHASFAQLQTAKPNVILEHCGQLLATPLP